MISSGSKLKSKKHISLGLELSAPQITTGYLKGWRLNTSPNARNSSEYRRSLIHSLVDIYKKD